MAYGILRRIKPEIINELNDVCKRMNTDNQEYKNLNISDAIAQVLKENVEMKKQLEELSSLLKAKSIS